MTAELTRLLQVVDTIYRETGGRDAEHAERGEVLDDFSKMRLEITEDLRIVREDIAARNKMKDAHQDASVAAKSQEIRRAIRALREKQKTMQAILAKAEKKKSPTAEESALLTDRKELMGVIESQIAECEQLERQPFSQATDAMFGGILPGGPVSRVAVPTDIEMGQLSNEFQQSMQVVDQQDQQIDRALDRIGDHLDVLQTYAQAMGTEMDRQQQTMDNLETHVDKQNVRLKKLNHETEKLVKSQRCSAANIIVYVVLIIVILALIGVIVSVVKTRTT